MSEKQSNQSIAIPEGLQRQLGAFRKRVWSIKMLESFALATLAIFFGFFAVFLLDRVFDSPGWVRAAVLLASTTGVATIPLWFQRWVLGVRSSESIAKLLGKKMPAVGDSLLGAIELSSSTSEQKRSPALCRAALEQVAAESSKKNLLDATPQSFHRGFSAVAATGVAIAVSLGMIFPAAAKNAWARFWSPLSQIERYTFAALDGVPSKVIVPHGESFPIAIKLAPNSEWNPSTASASIGTQTKLESPLADQVYAFDIPPQISEGKLDLQVGDATPSIVIEPKLRPELEALIGTVLLPAYLGRDAGTEKDVRGGGITMVRGANLVLKGETSSHLEDAFMNETKALVSKDSFQVECGAFDVSTALNLKWTDVFGLQAKVPFVLNVNVREDEPPSVYCDGLPRSRVLLDSEQLPFTVRSLDDFGVKHIGMEWRTAEGFETATPVSGEMMLAAGNPNAESLDGLATFQATTLKIPSQPIEVRLFAEDYLPDRGRVYSSPHLLYVLNPDDHAAWILEQINKWQREALEVRDRELQLLAGNKKIRDLPEEELNQEDTRRKIEQQASAEQANGRRLNNLTSKGEELLRQAARNKEIGVGHLEKWAEMQQVLKDIASNRMPSVAELLKQAKDEKKLVKASAASPSQQNPAAGVNRDPSQATAGSEPNNEPKPETPPVPTISDQESSQQPAIASDGKAQQEGKSPAAALRLPSTTVMGKPQSPSDQATAPEENKVEEAVRKQEDLLAEFDKIAEEMNKLMANLEGSTLVKRLKAASREQIQIADATSLEVEQAFGSKWLRLKSEQQNRIAELKGREEKALDTVSVILDDLEAFHERRPMVKFQSVLEEMRTADVLAGIRTLSERMAVAQGIAISEAEYWSDSLDRWAEDLVDPACKGECKGGKNKSSLPPSIILEVMQILEAEMNLRDRTRVAEQAKAVSEPEQYSKLAVELAESQMVLEERIAIVRTKIIALPDAQAEFIKEIELMQEVDLAMLDAAGILKRPDTGKLAIAAQTEVIELLLKSKRINPKGGGGGGASPGGGSGGGDTQDAAIALLGPGINEKENREDHGVQQSTGMSGTSFPEEYRQGLDQYFEKLERKALP